MPRPRPLNQVRADGIRHTPRGALLFVLFAAIPLSLRLANRSLHMELLVGAAKGGAFFLLALAPQAASRNNGIGDWEQAGKPQTRGAWLLYGPPRHAPRATRHISAGRGWFHVPLFMFPSALGLSALGPRVAGSEESLP
jgi:hypothetical protein